MKLLSIHKITPVIRDSHKTKFHFFTQDKLRLPKEDVQINWTGIPDEFKNIRGINLNYMNKSNIANNFNVIRRFIVVRREKRE